MIKLASGFSFDYQNMMGTGKITAEDIVAFAPQIEKAEQAITEMRKTGYIRGHLSKDGEPEKVLFSQLPYVEEGYLNSPASLAKLDKLQKRVRNNVDVVVSMGIGGSYLGNKVLFDVQCGSFWNYKTVAERNGYPQVFFSGNNIDPQSTGDLLHYLQAEAKKKSQQTDRKYRVLIICISKSGGTLDTMSSFMVVYEALKNHPNIDLEVIAITDPNTAKPTLLKKLAQDNAWETFAVPDGVGGRFTVFCEVGLVLGAIIGFDIHAFLQGAKDMDKACQTEDVYQNPALLNAVLKYIGAEKYGRSEEVLMPYGDYLESISMWYTQLLAESLGKHYNKSGQEVFYGRTPIVALGTRDMHSQTQQHQDGKLNKVVQFVRVEHWQNDLVIPNAFPQVESLAAIAGITMSSALETARESNAEALASGNRFNACFTLPTLNAYHLGELLYLLALSIAYEGEFADVDAFDQPGVEAYKKIMQKKLATLQKK